MYDPEPKEQGKLAAAKGEPLSANPYPQDSDDHDEWEEGWNYYHEVEEDGELLDD